MTARVSLDSNVLIYAEGNADVLRRDVALSLIDVIGPERILLPMQTAGETVNWLVRKGGLSRAQAAERMRWWTKRVILLPLDAEAFHAALTLVEKHAFQLWDAVIVAASAQAGADCLLSEDMQHGFSWNGMTIINPFVLTTEQRSMLAAGGRRH